MRPEFQILLGSVLLCVCAIWHIYAVTELITRMRKRFGGQHDDQRASFNVTVYIFMGIIGTHTVQLYLWALSFWFLGAIADFPTAIYFSLVTYTALGYGDVVLGENFRIFGAMESITGLLMFGITTAFLVGYFSILMRKR